MLMAGVFRVTFQAQLTPATASEVKLQNEPLLCEDYTITEKAPIRAFIYLKAPSSAFTFNVQDICRGLLCEFKTLPKVRCELYCSGSTVELKTENSLKISFPA